MKYWIDVENGEYGMVADPDNLRGVPVRVESGLSPWDCESLLAKAHENGAVLVVEAMAELDALIQAFEGLALSFIYSPVPPTFRGNRGEVPSRALNLEPFDEVDSYCAELSELAA